MKRAFRFSIHSGRLSRDERLHYFSFSVRKLPLGCFAASPLAMTIQLDLRPLVGRSRRWPNKGAHQTFFKLLQNSRVLLQAFPKKALAVLWDLKGLQGFQTSFDGFQIFLRRPPLFGRILDAAGPHSAASLGARPAVRLILRCSSVDDAFIAEPRSR